MNVSVGRHFEELIASLVARGRYGSEAEVLRAGLRLVEERERTLAALKETVEMAVAGGGAFSSEEIMGDIRSRAAKLKAGA